jgi:hypothetical protein
MNPQKKMYKVISPIEKKGGGTYWMRVGSAYTNRDDSINLYLDAVPVPNGKSSRYELQIRELTEEDLRRRETPASGNNGGGGFASRSTNGAGGDGPERGGFADLGGIGGGPSTRAVTSGGPSDSVPF